MDKGLEPLKGTADRPIERRPTVSHSQQTFDDLQTSLSDATEALFQAKEQLKFETDARKRAETALRASRDQLAAFQDGIFLLERDGTILEVNQIGAERFDMSVDEMLGCSIFDLMPPELAQSRRASLAQIDAGGTFELLDQRDGRWFESLVSPVSFADGKVDRFVVISSDVTDRKLETEARKKSEKRFRDFAESTSDWIWETDADNRYTLLSSPSQTGVEMPEQWYLGKSVSEIVDEFYERAEWQPYFEDFEARRSFRDLVLRRTGEDGGTQWIKTSGRPYFDADGNFQGFRGTACDFTEHKLAEDALRHREELQRRLMTAIDGVGELISIYDSDDKLVFANQALRDPKNGLADILYPGITFKELIDVLVKNNTPLIMGGLPKHQNPGEPFEITRQDGITLLLHEQVTADGSTVTIGHDITQHKRFEEQIRHSQKMEAMGQLTGGIAHDFNNLLAAIIGNLDLIENGSVNDEPNKEIFATISRAALRGSELTHRLLAFSRQQPLQAKRTQANELVPAFCRLAQRTIGEDISIEMSLAPNLWPTIVDIGQLENALLNLAINARDAMPDGGRLMIGTTNRVLDEDAVAMHMDVARGAYVEIAISDNGTGIPEDLIERVFEPFFTTKEVGQGSGLGLSMVFGFTRQSGGHVTIESKEGKGTTVRILLPRAEVAINVESDAEVSPAERPPGNETILVVEDDPDVLNFLVKGLHRLGYTVLQASDGPSALRVMAEPDAIDLLLTDVILPLGMSGRDVASAFRERNPGSGILYSSGYAKDVLSNRGQLDEEAKLIMKPYQFPTLAQQVREILDG